MKTLALLLLLSPSAEERFTLKNGLEVVLKRVDQLEAVVVGIAYRAGTLDDPPGRIGLAHLIEHLVFRGATASFKPGEAETALAGRGLLKGYAQSANAETMHDFTYYYSLLPPGEVDLALRVESERMAGVTLTQELLEAERAKALQEVRFVSANPAANAWSRIRELAYGDHPYARPKAGTVEGLRAVTLQDARDFLQKWYSPANALLVVYGKVDLAETRKLVEKRFASVPRRPVPARAVTKVEAHKETKRATLQQGTPLVFVAWPSAPHGTREKVALWLAVLQANRAAPMIFDDLTSRETSLVLWQTTGKADEKKIFDAVAAPVDVETRRREALVGFEADDTQPFRFVSGETHGLRMLAQVVINRLRREAFGSARMADLKKHLGEVTAGEVRAAARKWLAPERASVLKVGPK